MTNLLTRGNGKLGEGIHGWSLPAVETCPGSSTLCESVCYARSGRFRTRLVQDRLRANLGASLENDFGRRIVAEIRRRGVRTLRIHVAGDFYAPEYAAKWAAVARRCRRTKFYCYTRSWRRPEFSAVMSELASLSNVRMWWSADAETGIPADVPAGVEVAYLQREVADDPQDAEVVFRVRHLRNSPTRRIGLATVCPTETGLPRAAEVTCTSCRRCFR